MEDLLSYFVKEENLVPLINSLEVDINEGFTSQELLSGLKSPLYSISEGLTEVNKYFPAMDDAYKNSRAWKNMSKASSAVLDEYKKGERGLVPIYLVFYLYVLTRESYRFADDQDKKLEIYHTEGSLKKVLSVLDKSMKSKELNGLWTSYIGPVSLELEQSRRKVEVGRIVSLAVDQEMKKVSGKVNDAENRAKNVEELVNNSLKSHNFVTLSKGFDALKNDIVKKIVPLENTEKYFKWAILLFAGVFAVIKFFTATTIEHLPGLIAPAIFIAVLVYFMRLAISEKKVEQRRVHEIENKIAVIAFIEEYVGFYKSNKDKAEDVMNSFNDLIFHPIYREVGGDKEPKIYDGFEQVINFVKPGKKE